MATRSYNTESRRRKQAELKARIAGATAELHAAKGALATSYADIAKHAGVSLPTVHSHFPSQDALLHGCTSHVAAKAPELPAEVILTAPDLRSAAEALATAMERQHQHYEPWLAWREDRVVPFLAEMAAGVRTGRTALVARVLRRHLGPGSHRDAVAGWEAVLSFDFWHRLTHGHGLTSAAARRIVIGCLLAIAGVQPTADTTPRPRRKP